MARYAKTCSPCQDVKSEKTRRPATAKSIIPKKRFSSLQLDVVGPLPVSRGMKYIFKILDMTTRWLEAIPMPEATARSCATAFTEEWIPRYGLPGQAKSDNGNTFVKNVWHELNTILGVEVKFLPFYHALSLG